jgi:hypothetical protein
MNDPLVHRLAKGFAARLQRERTDETARIEHSYLLAFGRPPTNDERGTATAFLGKMRSSLSQAGVNGKECEAQVWESYARALFLSNELVYVN